MKTKREYDVFLFYRPSPIESADRLMQLHKWLNERGADGYRLIRAEDSGGLLHYVMERVTEVEG